MSGEGGGGDNCGGSKDGGSTCQAKDKRKVSTWQGGAGTWVREGSDTPFTRAVERPAQVSTIGGCAGAMAGALAPLGKSSAAVSRTLGSVIRPTCFTGPAGGAEATSDYEWFEWSWRRRSCKPEVDVG